ncbi:MAG TPA: 30S ribosome-binding factor RbfA [Clostridiales bacterium]|nr:30S ribosome-binding factor RbfA [Clostridiales bacterium]
MVLATNRINRLNEELKREISEIIHKSVKDPRIPDFVSVTRVETSKDMKHAKVYISVLDNNADTKDLEAALKSATGFIKKEIAKGVKMRFIPELQFIMDHSIEYGMRMAKLIDDLKNAERE